MTIGDALECAGADSWQGVSTDDQLRYDLRAARTATTLPGTQASDTLHHLRVLARMVHRWLPVAREYRAAAAGSPAQLRRWDRVLERAVGPDVLARPVDQLGAWAHEVHTLLETVREARRAGQVTAAVVGQTIAARVQDGEYYPGCVLSSYRIALDYGLPQAVADDAVQDLLACGVLESSGGRAAPAGSRAAREHMEKVITDRLRAQIAAGLYPPHSTLPSRRELAQVLWSVLAHVTGALRTLAGEGLVTTGPGPVRVTAAAADLPPAPRDEPPPCATPYSSAVITRQTQDVIDRWRLRRPAPAAVVEESWDVLRQMTVQLLHHCSAPENAVVVRRAVEVARAPWPDSSWERVWHTACLARAVAALQHHVNQLDRPSAAARGPE